MNEFAHKSSLILGKINVSPAVQFTVTVPLTEKLMEYANM